MFICKLLTFVTFGLSLSSLGLGLLVLPLRRPSHALRIRSSVKPVNELSIEPAMKRPTAPYNKDIVNPVIALIIQNSALILCMRYTLVNKGISGPYLSSTAVFFSEVLKVIVCCFIVFIEEAKGNVYSFCALLKSATVDNTDDVIALTIPAFLYILQNNLQYKAVANLSPAVFQVLYQMKVITAAIFSVFILKRGLRVRQWASIVLLMIGLVITQISQRRPVVGLSYQACNAVGYLAVFLSAMTSGLAGVYTEKLMKSDSKSSLWMR